MCVVDTAGPLADPQEVSRQVIEPGLRIPGQSGPVVGQAEHGSLVVEYQRLVGGKDVRGAEVLVRHTTGVHEPESSVDLGRQRLISGSGRRTRDELHVPLVNAVQVSGARGGQRADQVHRGGSVGVGTDQP